MGEKSSVKRTKKAIHIALISLMSKKKLRNINVSELCRQAEINRSTFYYYYNTPEDCFYEMANIFVDELVHRFRKINVYDKKTFMQIFLTIIDENYIVARELFDSGMSNLFFERIQREINVLTTGDRIPKHMMRFICYGTYGIILDWLNNKSENPIDDLIEIFEHFETLYR